MMLSVRQLLSTAQVLCTLYRVFEPCSVHDHKMVTNGCLPATRFIATEYTLISVLVRHVSQWIIIAVQSTQHLKVSFFKEIQSYTLICLAVRALKTSYEFFTHIFCSSSTCLILLRVAESRLEMYVLLPYGPTAYLFSFVHGLPPPTLMNQNHFFLISSPTASIEGLNDRSYPSKSREPNSLFRMRSNF